MASLPMNDRLGLSQSLVDDEVGERLARIGGGAFGEPASTPGSNPGACFAGSMRWIARRGRAQKWKTLPKKPMTLCCSPPDGVVRLT